MTAETLTLTDFLLARIAEDEEWAGRDIQEGRRRGSWPPVRVLAECKAKRLIVEKALEQPPTGANLTDYMLGIWAARHAALYDLAGVYSDHPDYRQEWKP